MQVVALHVADQLAVQVQLVQVTTAVVQMVQVLAGRQGQRGQVAERVVLVVQGALWRGFFNKATQQVVLEGQGFGGDAELPLKNTFCLKFKFALKQTVLNAYQTKTLAHPHLYRTLLSRNPPDNSNHWTWIFLA